MNNTAAKIVNAPAENNTKKKNAFSRYLERNKESGGYLLKKHAGKWAFNIIRALMLFGLCFLIIQPLLNKLTVSFMMEKDLYDATVISIPRNFTVNNYKFVSELISFPTSLLKTFLMALVVGVLQIASCTLAGYGFARFNFPLKKLWFMCVMLIIVIPPQTIMSSLYLHFRFFDVFGIITLIMGEPINMLNNSAPYLMMSATCMGLKNGLYIFMIRQYFRGLPKEVEEAAYVDGCGKLRTFLQIMLPDSRPIITSCFLFSFVWQWTDSLYSNLFLRNLNLLPNSLRSIGEKLNNYYALAYGTGSMPTMGYQQQLIATGMLMFIAPLIILYLFAQKGFVESLSQSGVKM